MCERLRTERLVLRRFRPDDWAALGEYVNHPLVSAYEPDYPCEAPGWQSLAEFFSGTPDFWAVCLADEGALIGHVHWGLREPDDLGTHNLGFVFNPAFWGKGYAFEAAEEAMRHGFVEAQVRRFESGCNPENTRSWRLLERLGMRREGHHLQNACIKREPDGTPIFWDSYVYAILRTEWLARHGAT